MARTFPAEYKTEFETTKDIPYLALMGELWDVFGENFGENAFVTPSVLAFNSKMVNQHDDVIKWKHFPRNWSFVRGIHRSR